MPLYEVQSDGTLVKKAGGVGLQYDSVAQVSETMNVLLNTIYPIGSIRLSINPNETSFLGGTWVKIMDSFIVGAGNTYNVGDTGGNATHNHTLGSGYADFMISWSSSDSNFIVYKDKSASYTGSTKMTNLPGYISTSTNPGVGTALGGNTDNSSSLPPYIAVFIYKRTA